MHQPIGPKATPAVGDRSTPKASVADSTASLRGTAPSSCRVETEQEQLRLPGAGVFFGVLGVVFGGEHKQSAVSTTF